VEDQADLAEFLAVTIRKMGMETTIAPHGSRAFARFSQQVPDLILLDIGLPDITGWKVLDGLKAWARDNNAVMPRVIVITAMGDAANRVVGKLQGVHSYIIKPFTTDELEQAVSSALQEGA
jgi:two-component system KDP operon response regulator KdpE